MTGKEALIHLSKTCKELELEYGNFKINKKDNEALQTLKEIVQKYDKYKRAFEILKDKGIVEIEKYTNIGSVIYKAYGCERYLEQEEHELLEELMKDE